MRTTSSLESLNAVLRRRFPLHPHIFKFMERLQYFEIGQQLKMHKLVGSDNDSSQSRHMLKKYKLRDANIRATTEELRTNPTFTVGDFLETLVTDKTLHSSGKELKSMKICDQI